MRYCAMRISAEGSAFRPDVGHKCTRRMAVAWKVTAKHASESEEFGNGHLKKHRPVRRGSSLGSILTKSFMRATNVANRVAVDRAERSGR